MKAVRIHGYGGVEALKYEDAPKPVAADGEVVVRIHNTTVNPFDVALRSGYLAGYFQPKFPLILGTDVAGTIDSVGPGVTGFKPGDKVYGRGGVFRDGAYAEYIALAASDVAAMPKSADFKKSAALPHVILTAWQALIDSAGLTKGQTVLVHGAAGGVGHVAVQLAKLRGAKVIGTGSKNIDFVRQLGVDQAIDYVKTKFEEVVRDVDVVLDTVGGDTQERSWGVLKRGGMLVSTVQPPSQETADARGVRQAMIATNPPIGQTLTAVAKMVDAGELKPEVSKVLPLEKIAEAHELIATRHTRGKIVLDVAPE
jgi:NADPH:quinone reductase-like Zn-dependent oxidoreductase